MTCSLSLVVKVNGSVYVRTALVFRHDLFCNVSASISSQQQVEAFKY